jgi:hypothetical protein
MRIKKCLQHPHTSSFAHNYCPYLYCLRVRLNSLKPSSSERNQPAWRYDFLNIILGVILKQSLYTTSFYSLTLLLFILQLFFAFKFSFSFFFFFSFVFTICFSSPLPPFTFSAQIPLLLYIITIRIFHINEMKW